jgi:uncharacterized protein YdcH (DUF465 family)
MFEYDEKVVQHLLSSSDQFRRLYEKHHDLKRKVHEAHIGTLPLDDYTLENMKKEKLLLKDQMAGMIAKHRQAHTPA